MRYKVETTAQNIQEESRKGWKPSNIFKEGEVHPRTHHEGQEGKHR
jgi:hypothetical protein